MRIAIGFISNDPRILGALLVGIGVGLAVAGLLMLACISNKQR
jgi:ABC-type Fe3+-siderophore transport system permease subunit